MLKIITILTLLMSLCSCQNSILPLSLFGEFKVNQKYAPNGLFKDLYINNKGNGLIFWAGGYKKIKNYEFTNDEYSFEKTIGYLSTSLNDDGNGIAIITPNQINFSENLSKKERVDNSNFYTIIDNYKPSENYSSISIYLNKNEYTPSPDIFLDNEGNGVIYWVKRKREVEYKNDEIGYININRFKIGESINTKTIKINEGLPIIKFDKNELDIKYISDPSISSINGATLDEYGNGFISWSRDYSQLIKVVKNYTPHGKEIIMSDFYQYESISLNKNGDGAFIYKQAGDNGDFSMIKISNYLPTKIRIPITNKPFQAKFDPILKLDQNGNGFVIWSEYNGAPEYKTNIMGKYIRNYIPT